MANVETLQALIGGYRRKLVWTRALMRGLEFLVWGALAALSLALFFRLTGLERAAGLATVSFLPLALVAGFVLGWRRSACSDYQAAKLIDARLGHGDRLANALYWLKQPPARRNAFVELAIKEGLEATKNASSKVYPAFAWTRQARLGLGMACFASIFLIMLFPAKIIPPEEAVSAEAAEQMQKIFKSLGELSSKDGADDKHMKELLEQLNISEEDMSKMTQAEIMRMLNEKGIQFKGGEKAKAVEAIKGALAQIDLIKQQMAEIEKKNNTAYAIKTKDGAQISGSRIKTVVTDENILLDRVKRAAGMKEDESAILADLERESEAARQRGKEVRGKAGLAKEVSYSVDPQAALKADERFQNDVREAIKDPNGEAAQRVKKAYLDLARKDLEKGDIPSGAADKMLKWMRSQ